MVNNFLKAVTKHLGTTFGSSYHYYMENVEQGLIKPCFTVDVLEPLQRSRNQFQYERTMPLVIHYFSDSKTDSKKDSYAMGERIVECMEYLPFKGTLLMGRDISFQMVEDVLQVFVTYKFTTQKDSVGKEDKMSTFGGTVTHTQ